MGATSEVKKNRLVFLPDAEFMVLRGLIPRDNVDSYDALDEKGISNFKLKDSSIIFVEESYRESLMLKAKKGIPL